MRVVPRSLSASWRRSLQHGCLPLTARSRRNICQTIIFAQQQQSGQRTARDDLPPVRPSSSNPALSFPCLDAVESRTAALTSRPRGQSNSNSSPSSSLSGPEPAYTTGKHESFTSSDPLLLDWGGLLPSFTLAYETWGRLNADRSNAILLHTGLSASSHAHSTSSNPKPGWWERFIGAGESFPLDTNRYFIICTNVLGGCYGSTGPYSIDPSDSQRYATRFPILTLDDMVRAQFRLLTDHFHINRLAASVGASMGGMLSLASSVLYPDRVARCVTISGCARSHPYSIAMRHTQRQVLMMDPNWRRGFYYPDGDGNGVPPHAGLKLAREIATVTYRSGPEWEQRFGRRRADPNRPPALCPDFLIETYLDHAGEKWCLEYDANSFLYVSKAMDLFDLGAAHRARITEHRTASRWKLDALRQGVGSGTQQTPQQAKCDLTLPDKPYEEKQSASSTTPSSHTPDEPPADLIAGLAPMANVPTLVLGVASDILFPAWQQREVASALRKSGNGAVTHVELGEDRSLFGHDTFLLDLEGVGGAVGDFLR